MTRTCPGDLSHTHSGGRESAKRDSQGKTRGQGLLRMELDLPGDVSLMDLQP